MKRIMFVCAMLAAGCAADPVEEAEERARAAEEKARQVFEAWNRANESGDADASFLGMSASLRSQWLYQMMEGRSDEITQSHLALLEPELRDILDKWFQISKESTKTELQRAVMLPASIRASQWLAELWRKHFEEGRETTVAQAKLRQVEVVSVDAKGATINTQITGVKEMWGLIWEGEGWKIDSYRAMARQPR